MQPIVFQENMASRRAGNRLKAFVMAFGVSLVAAVAILAIWDDPLATAGGFDWAAVPPVRVWACLLILLGTPALTATIFLLLPLPHPTRLIIDATGVSEPILGIARHWPWSNISGLEFYPHPDGKSVVRLGFHSPPSASGALVQPRATEVRISDIYETPLREIFERLQDMRGQVSDGPDPSGIGQPDGPIVFVGDPVKQAYRPYSALLLMLGGLLFTLNGVFAMPFWLLGVVAAVIVATIVVIVARDVPAFRTGGGARQLRIDANGFELVRGRRRDRLSWSDVVDVRLHGRTGFWETPRAISLGMRRRSHGTVTDLFRASRFVIPDVFLASVDEIAERLKAFHEHRGEVDA